MSKITIPVRKPRNPFVALARARKAGAHGPTRRSILDRVEKREIRRGHE